MNIANNYIKGLQNAYDRINQKEEWEHFISIKNGISKDNLEKLKTIYPNIPKSHLELLEFVDGTYYKEYKGEKITFYLLGSDIEEYPYYLLSSDEIIKNTKLANDYYADYVDREYEGEVLVDDRIISNSEEMNWLHFSDCMNNGGTSQLFIDFSPSDIGTSGQIVRFLHDPDEIKVIASSFDEYLQMIIDDEFDFICDFDI